MSNFKKKMIAISLSAFMLIGVTGCMNEGDKNKESKVQTYEAFTVTSKVGDKVIETTFDKVPERAVSTAGFTTEMLLALGVEKNIAGYSYQDNEVPDEYKAAYDTLKKLSDTLPPKEVLLSVEPDFITGWNEVFTDKYYSVEFLESNKIKIYIPKVEESRKITMEDLYEDITTLGKIFGVSEKAAELNNKFKTKIDNVESKVKGLEKVPVFLYDSGEEAPFTVGFALATDIIEKAGGKNIVENADKLWLSTSWEIVVEKNPKYILVMKYDISDDAEGKVNYLKTNPAFKDIDAVKNDNILVMDLSDVIGGIRNADAIETLAKFFHPDAFK